MRILVIKLDRLGDFVLATPFLRGLRALHPDARIMLAVRDAVMPLAESCALVDRLVVVPTAALGREAVLRDLGVRVRQDLGPFDLVIVARWDIDYYGAGLMAEA